MRGCREHGEAVRRRPLGRLVPERAQLGFGFFRRLDGGRRDLNERLEQLGLDPVRSEEHTSELQSPCNLVCRLLLEKKNNTSTLRVVSRIFFGLTSSVSAKPQPESF